MNIILRRNDVGDPFANNIAANMPGFSVVNKDAVPIPRQTRDDWCVRWGTTSSLNGDPKVINSAKAIHRVYDKGKFRKTMSNAGVAPKTWDSLESFLSDQVYPVILRPLHHVRSFDLHFCENLEDVVCAFLKHRNGYYISEYIKKDAEFRVFVVQGRAVAVIKKVPVDPRAVSWGCVTQGAFNYIEWSNWPVDPVEKAVKAFLLSDLDFGAVDVISKDGIAYVLEINTAPEVTPYYGKTIAKAFNYMVQNGRDPIQVTGRTWKHFIHPALTSEAIS